MDDWREMLVQTVNCLKNIEKVHCCSFGFKLSNLFKPGIEMTLLSKFHDEIDVLLIFEVGDKFHDIRMVQRGHNLHFIPQLAHHPQLLNHLFLNNFESILILGLFAKNANHLAICTLA